MAKGLVIIASIIYVLMTIGIASADTMFAGNCLPVNLSELKSLDNVVYDVVENESNLNGLTIDLNETTAIANICTVPNYKPDSFTIIFIDNSTQTIVKEIPVGGGSGGTRKVYIEKETIVEVDKYIDSRINETEIQRLDDELQRIKDDLTKKNKRLTYFLGILLTLFSFLLIYTLRKNINKLMKGLKISQKK